MNCFGMILAMYARWMGVEEELLEKYWIDLGFNANCDTPWLKAPCIQASFMVITRVVSAL